MLRDYQLEALEKIWNALYSKQAALCVLPTGSGKTHIFQELIRKAIKLKPSVKIVVLFNNIDLLEQTEERFLKEFKSVGIYCGSLNKRETHATITLATVQSLSFIRADLCIIDEVHNLNVKSGRYIDLVKKLECKVLGFTATPFRVDGVIYGRKDSLFKKIDYQKSIDEMIEDGYLVPPRLKKPDEQFDISGLRTRNGEYRDEDIRGIITEEKSARQVKDALGRIRDRKKIVWFCSSIEHATQVYEHLRVQDERSAVLHSGLHRGLRDYHKRAFTEGDARHLVFINIVREGFDYPPIDAIVFLRPTRSAVLYVQVVGRGLRPSEGKKDCLVLDYGKVVETLGPLNNIRLPERGSAKTLLKRSAVKFCPTCYEYVETGAAHCPICHHKFFERTLKLTRVPDQRSNLLGGSAVETLEIKDVRIRKYTSKAGNPCWVFTYYPRNFLASPINEYFVLTNQWAVARCKNRLKELGSLATPGGAIPQVLAPKEIRYRRDGKYYKIAGIVPG